MDVIEASSPPATIDTGIPQQYRTIALAIMLCIAKEPLEADFATFR